MTLTDGTEVNLQAMVRYVEDEYDTQVIPI